MSTDNPSPCSRALLATKQGKWSEAEKIISLLIADTFNLDVLTLTVSRDRYSLNSVNGFVTTALEGNFFFKFHHEEGEEVTLEELYRGEILKEIGYPIDMPIYVSRAVGEQLLLYRKRVTPRFADICRTLDFGQIEAIEPAVSAQADLDLLTGRIYLETLHEADPAKTAIEPINQLFFHRLVEPVSQGKLGGRAKRFFWDRQFQFPGLTVSAEELRRLKWMVNGSLYRDTIGDLLARSLILLEPSRLAAFGAVTAHGDAHNANVWWDETSSRPKLVFFDPAFAGSEISALLAEVKATFHNILAHPLWLYDADAASERYTANARREGDTIIVETDWELSPLRKAFLETKAQLIWKPLLAELQSRKMLPNEWRQTIRCALFCCPTLVMDLCAGGAGGHNPISSILGLSSAVAAGSERESGEFDLVSTFLDVVAP